VNHLEALKIHLQHPQRRATWGTIPPVVCADGFTMSVQANEHVYCTPQSNIGPWVTVEVGFPNRVEPLLWPYAESPGDWTDTVYPRVPVELVAAVIEVHGGFQELWKKDL